MKWIVVAAIVVIFVVQARNALTRHPIFGPVFRVLFATSDRPRDLTAREYLIGAAAFSGFAAVSLACRQAVIHVARDGGWIDLGSPLVGVFVTMLLWVSGIALVGAAYSVCVGLQRILRRSQSKNRPRE